MIRSAAACVALFVFGFGFAACDTVRGDRFPAERPWGHRPQWVDTLAEATEAVPPAEAPERAPLVTPTAWPPADEPAARGVPDDLTARLAEPVIPAPSAAAPESARPASRRNSIWSRGPTPPSQEQQDPVVVNVTQTNAAPADSSASSESSGSATLDAEDEHSRLEQMYGGSYGAAPDRNLRQFGYDYFDQEVAVDELGPVPSDYVVMPGDQLIVTFEGTLEGDHELVVNRNGRVTIPKLGSVVVAGRRFDELDDAIADFVRRVGNRRNFEVRVALGELRKFRVHVVGEVEQPGLIEVPARSTVLTALVAAGGPKKSGSLRRIEVRRGDERRTIDLYDFLTSGAAGALDVLQPEDVIAVPSIGPTIGVAGYVQRPGIYEIEGEPTVEAAIALAGGLTPFTFTRSAQIERTVAGRGRQTIDIELDDGGRATAMADGELLMIGAVDGRFQPLVQVLGEVVRPGSYQFRDGMKISDLLKLADGLLVDAYLPQAFVSRQVGAVGSLTVVPEREGVGTTRRVLVLDLAKALAGDPEHDLELRPLDQLKVVASEDAMDRPTVTIIGAVRNPGTYELTAGLRVSELVAIAANVLPEVYYDEAELIRRVYNATTKQLDVRRYRFDLGDALRGAGGEADPVLANRDQLVIRALRSSHVRVRIEGDVRFPGDYVFPEGARITDLFAAAGGALENADLRATMFLRDSVKRAQQERWRHLKEETRNTFEAALEMLVRDGFPREGLAGKLSLDQTIDLMGRLDRVQSVGRIVIPFLDDGFPGSVYNLTLEDGDRLVVPRRRETVSILGHVFNPGAFVAEPGISVAEVVQRAGGLREEADEQRLYVLRADGIVESFRQDSYRLSYTAQLYPGDAILVPRRPIERSLGSRAADLLFLARRLGETALIYDALGQDFGVDFTSILNEGLEKNTGAYVDQLLR